MDEEVQAEPPRDQCATERKCCRRWRRKAAERLLELEKERDSKVMETDVHSTDGHSTPPQQRSTEELPFQCNVCGIPCGVVHNTHAIPQIRGYFAWPRYCCSRECLIAYVSHKCGWSPARTQIMLDTFLVDSPHVDAAHENTWDRRNEHTGECGTCQRSGCPYAHRYGPRRHGFCCNACRRGEELHTNNCSGRSRRGHAWP